MRLWRNAYTLSILSYFSFIAKLGLIGLANTVSREGQKYNVFTNTVAPTAISRLTDNLMPQGQCTT